MNSQERKTSLRSIRTRLSMLCDAVTETDASCAATREALRDVLPAFGKAYDRIYQAQKDNLATLIGATIPEQPRLADQLADLLDDLIDGS
jgi:hypothetical protein